MRNIFLILLMFSLFHKTLSQGNGTVGTWKSHLPNKICYSVAAVGKNIVAGGPQTFFSYNTENKSVNQHSKINNYSGSSISQLGYNEPTNTLVVAYENSMIDLIVDKNIIPVNDLIRSSLPGSKKVNHLYMYQDKALISTDLGLLIYNVRKKQIEDLCRIFTPQNIPAFVTSSTILNDSIYVASDQGIFVVSNAPTINKLDYRNWKEIKTNSIPLLNSKFQYIAGFDNKLFCATGTGAESNILAVYQNGLFIDDPAQIGIVNEGNRNFNGLKVVNNQLWIFQINSLLSYKDGIYKAESRSINPKDIVFDPSGNYWVADMDKGLLLLSGNEYETININGPGSNFSFRLSQFNNKIFAVSGGYNFEYYGALERCHGFYERSEDGVWKSYSSNINNTALFCDVSSAKYNPITNKFFLGSYGNGILEWDIESNKMDVKNHFIPGVPLNGSKDFNGALLGTSSNRVPDLEIDSEGKVWILNTPDPHIGMAGIYTYDIAGRWDSIKWVGTDKWGSYNYSYLSTASYFLHRIFIDKNENKWLASRYVTTDQTSPLGLFIYNEKKSSLPRHLKYEQNGKKEICGKQVYTISQDLEGAIWIGTDNGICYFSDPEEVFLNKSVAATIPSINNQSLLGGITITGIDVDGSNRKWISTLNEGLILVSPDGNSILNRFNEGNSPLVSNSINDVEIIQSTGEVFVATDDGIFSYISNSVSGKDINENVIAFPNPIKPDFTGLFTIQGLVNKAVVKVTDLNGKLVFEGKAEGSLFTWNVKNYKGQRPEAGIYLVYSSTDEGKEELVTKIGILD